MTELSQHWLYLFLVEVSVVAISHTQIVKLIVKSRISLIMNYSSLEIPIEIPIKICC